MVRVNHALQFVVFYPGMGVVGLEKHLATATENRTEKSGQQKKHLLTGYSVSIAWKVHVWFNQKRLSRRTMIQGTEGV